MDIARTLGQAVGAWMQYEFACGRSALFNERYLSVPISNALYHLYKHQVWSEYLHPILAAEKVGPGRRPEVDFAVVNNYPHIECVVESKWVGNVGLSAEDVIWDLLRLELIAHHTKASAFFVLAGRKRHLEMFFRSGAFLGMPDSSGMYRRLLKLDRRKNARLRVDNPPSDRRAVYRKLFARYQNVSFSSRVTTSVPYLYPADCPTFQYQAYAWQVIAPAGTPRFFPKDHTYYVAGTSNDPSS